MVVKFSKGTKNSKASFCYLLGYPFNLVYFKET